MAARMEIRNLSPKDYQPIISIVNNWWGGRNMSSMLPKLFFIHFHNTSFLAQLDNKIVGFLVGFLSQTYPQQAYIHFVGIHPNFRNQGIGRQMYQKFFHTVKQFGCSQVKCVTSPLNKNSIAYHLRMGFEIEPSETQQEGVPYHLNYDGAQEDRVLFVKQL